MRGARRIRDELIQAQARMFVGREREKREFEALIDPQGGLRLLYVTGPGGIGKSTLLREFARIASARGMDVHYLDARVLPTSPQALTQYLLPLTGNDQERIKVLLFDTFEHLAMLEGWLRDVFVPDLTVNIRIVFGGRSVPATEWTTDPGWIDLMRVLHLAYFTESESAEYLARRQLAPELRPKALSFARGSPLALALINDVLSQHPAFELQGDESTDLLTRLVTRLLRGIDDPQKCLALQASSIVRSINEPMLAAMLDTDGTRTLFDWLRAQTFMETGARGVLPHDMVREVIVEDLRRRDPLVYERLIGRAYAETVRQLAACGQPEGEQAALDLFFVQRDTLLVRKIYRLNCERTCYCDAVADPDWPLICDMVERHEGAESLALLQHWRARQPEGLVAVRDREQRLLGFLYALDVARVSAREAEIDSVVQSVRDYLETQPPMERGQKAILFRTWMSAESYQAVSPVQTQVCAHILFRTLNTPGLAYVFHIQPDHPVWERISDQCGHVPLPTAMLEIGGLPSVLYLHDYRRESPLEWIRQLHGRLRDTSVLESVPAISGADFENAVKAALRGYHCPERLRQSPLLASRLVSQAVGNDPDPVRRTHALREVLAATCEVLGQADHDPRMKQILHSTYLRPARSQGAAAEALAMSERSYRRHLSRAVKLFAAQLWEAETSRR